MKYSLQLFHKDNVKYFVMHGLDVKPNASA